MSLLVSYMRVKWNDYIKKVSGMKSFCCQGDMHACMYKTEKENHKILVDFLWLF